MKKKLIALSLVLAVCAGLFSNGSEDKSAADSKKKEKMIIALDKMPEDYKLSVALEELQSMDKYSHVEFEILGKEADFLTTMPIVVASGEQRDLVAVANPILQASWSSAGTIQPLDEYIDNLSIDFEKEYGSYAENAKNGGEIFIIPHNITKWSLYYIKDRFDEAGLPYPDPEVPMTWAEYRELAAALTSGVGSGKVYGALHLTWPMYWYGEAIQMLGGGEKFYNDKGLSNIENPAFSKALERTYAMMHLDKSIPTHADLMVSKTKAPAFMTGKYAMTFMGGWVLSWATDRESYPRDFEIGMAPMPVDEGTTSKTWGIVNGFAVPVSSGNPELAVEIGVDLTRLSAKYAQAAVEANQTVEQKDLYTGIAEKLQAEGITREVIFNIFANSETVFLTEKVTGPNNVQYEKIINEEVEKYLIQEQSLEETISNIKERGDKAILGD